MRGRLWQLLLTEGATQAPVIEMNYPEANLWVLKAVSRQDPFIRSKLRGMDPRGIQFVQDVKDKFDTRV